MALKFAILCIAMVFVLCPVQVRAFASEELTIIENEEAVITENTDESEVLVDELYETDGDQEELADNVITILNSDGGDTTTSPMPTEPLEPKVTWGNNEWIEPTPKTIKLNSIPKTPKPDKASKTAPASKTAAPKTGDVDILYALITMVIAFSALRVDKKIYLLYNLFIK